MKHSASATKSSTTSVSKARKLMQESKTNNNHHNLNSIDSMHRSSNDKNAMFLGMGTLEEIDRKFNSFSTSNLRNATVTGTSGEKYFSSNNHNNHQQQALNSSRTHLTTEPMQMNGSAVSGGKQQQANFAGSTPAMMKNQSFKVTFHIPTENSQTAENPSNRHNSASLKSPTNNAFSSLQMTKSISYKPHTPSGSTPAAAGSAQQKQSAWQETSPKGISNGLLRQASIAVMRSKSASKMQVSQQSQSAQRSPSIMPQGQHSLNQIVSLTNLKDSMLMLNSSNAIMTGSGTITASNSNQKHQQFKARNHILDIMVAQKAKQTSKGIAVLRQGLQEIDSFGKEKVIPRTPLLQQNSSNLNQQYYNDDDPRNQIIGTDVSIPMSVDGSLKDPSALSEDALDSLSNFIYSFVSVTANALLKSIHAAAKNMQDSKLNYQNYTSRASTAAEAATVLSPVEKIFETFNISKNTLLSLQTSNLKEDYIVKKIHANCAVQLESLIEKLDQRTQTCIKQEETQAKQALKPKIGEQFQWINIPCKYDALKKKVQQSLMDVLYGDDNVITLQEAKRRSIIENSGGFGEHADHILLELSKSTTKKRSFHLKMNDGGDDTWRSSSMAGQGMSPMKSARSSLLSNTTTGGGAAGFGAFTRSTSSRASLIKKANESQVKHSLKESALSIHLGEQEMKEKLERFVWDNSAERTFSSYKNTVKQKFKREMKGANPWQIIGMQPVIQSLGLEAKVDLYREQLMKQFREGDFLISDRERMFLVNTSALLNANIDRAHFQDLFDFVSEEDIGLLELRIAENTLGKYDAISNKLKTLRSEYVKRETDRTRKRMQAAEIKNGGNVLQRILTERSANVKRREFKIQVERMERTLQRKEDMINFYLQLRSNPYVQHFVTQMKKVLAKREIQGPKQKKQQTNYERFAKRNHPHRQLNSLFEIKQGEEKKPLNYKESQKLYHPTSRILLGLNDLKKFDDLKAQGMTEAQMTTSSAQAKQMVDLRFQREKNYRFMNRLADTKLLEPSQKDLFILATSNGPFSARATPTIASTTKVHQDYHNPTSNKPMSTTSSSDIIHKSDQSTLTTSAQAGVGTRTITGSSAANQISEKQINQHPRTKWITVETQHAACIVIQKWARSRIQMIKFQSMLSQKREEQEKKMFEILKKWKESKELLTFLHDHSRRIAQQRHTEFIRKKTKRFSTVNLNQQSSPTKSQTAIQVNTGNLNGQQQQQQQQQQQLIPNATIIPLDGLVQMTSSVSAANPNSYHRKQISECPPQSSTQEYFGVDLNAPNQKQQQMSVQNSSRSAQKNRSESISTVVSGHSRTSVASREKTYRGIDSVDSNSVYGNLTQKSAPASAARKAQFKLEMSKIHHAASKSEQFTSPQQQQQQQPYSNKNFDETTQHNMSHTRSATDFFTHRSELRSPSTINGKSTQDMLQNIDAIELNLHQKKQQQYATGSNEPARFKLSSHRDQIKEAMSKLQNAFKSKKSAGGGGGSMKERRRHEDLLLKQRKLFSVAKSGTLTHLKTFGFTYFESDVNQPDEEGNCPLYYVAARGEEDFVAFLLSVKADPNFVCSEGNTPMHAAFAAGKSSLIVTLMDAMGDLNVVNHESMTPLAFASEKLLRELGLFKGIAEITRNQPIDPEFDNNWLFAQKHKVQTEMQIPPSTSSIVPVAANMALRKKKEKLVEEEIEQEEIEFKFVNPSTAENYPSDANWKKKQDSSSNVLSFQAQSFSVPSLNSQRKV